MKKALIAEKNLVFSVTVFLFVVFFGGCTPPYVYWAYSPQQYTERVYPEAGNGKLIDIPTFPHEREVEVFFQNRTPNKPYLEVFLMEEIVYGNASYADLVKELQRRAQRKGVDALIILSRDRKEFETDFSFQVENTISALGVIYAENVKFEEGIPKRAHYYYYLNSMAEYRLAETLVSDVFGNLEPLRNNSYKKYFEYYSLPYMLMDKNKNWKYAKSDSTGRVVSRRLNQDGNWTTYYFNYDENQMIDRVLISLFSFTYKIDFEYDQNGRVIKKIGYKRGQRTPIAELASGELKKDTEASFYSYFTEIVEYHPKGSVLRRRIFVPSGEKQIPLQKLEYEFYTKKDFENALKQQVLPK